ncbi:Glycosyl transferase family 2 (fragment) [uncultured delta proteobacterium]|uniref:Glycosyl transferase family 2 n=1 Tax=uncultured delta proteobacterium TaxID=34034 RepID=A0A212KH54_9DELT
MPLLPPDVAIVLLNYNGGTDTTKCLQALYGLSSPPGQIIVVDNASTAEDRNVIEATWERLRKVSGKNAIRGHWVLLTENRGFSAGNNAGIQLALQDPACRAVWILNNDTEPAVEALETLCRRLNDNPKAGLAGSTLVYSHARNTVQCAGGFVLSRLTGATPALHGGESLETVGRIPPESVERKLGYLCGASILVRREVFKTAGFLPEEYFLYYEDAAFCLDAQRADYSLVWAPGSIVFHKEGGSTGAKSEAADRGLKRSRIVDYLALRNRIYLIRRYFPHCLPVAIASYAGVMLNRLRRGQGGRLPLVLKALADGI